MYIAVLVVSLAVLCIFVYWKREKQYEFAKCIPMLNPAYPLVGNGLLLFGKSDDERFRALRSMTSYKHQFTKFYLGTTMLLGTTDPEIAQQILSDPGWLEKPFFYEFFQLPYGLLSSKFDIWKVHRKVLNPTFNIRILQSFIPIFKQYAEKMVQILDGYPEGCTINVVLDLMTCSLITILQTTFGFNCENLDGYDVLGPKIERFFFLISKRFVTITHYPDFIYNLTEDGRENRKLRKYLDEWAAPVIDNVARHYSARNAENASDDDEHLKKPKVFVEELYTNKLVKFTRKEIADEAITMVGAGTDTSSNTLAYCLLSLAMHPDIQEKVYEEIMQVYPSECMEFTLESLKQLLYLEMVIQETLRMFPIGPMIFRQSMTDSTIGGLHIPKGNLIGIDIFKMHRRKDVYGEDADVFNPERFSPERSKGRNAFALLAFSGGSRGCIGTRYAMINMKIMVVHVVRNFLIKTQLKQEDLRFKFDVILRLQNGYLIQLERRKTDTTLSII